jgi:trans-aconitate methyltransferase
MARANTWNTELYEAKHDFVWKMAEGVLELLAPKAGERILDLGCGTGHLTQRIADAGAQVVGVDASPDMIGQARQNFPKLTFLLQNAAELTFDNEFDAIFSNAALHWMIEASTVAARMAAALKPGGRLVAELGGHGNIDAIVEAVHTVIGRYLSAIPASKNWYPSIAEYSTLLEAHGFEVRFARLFDRPTPLEGESGMDHWLRQFKSYYYEALPAGDRERAIAEAVDLLRPKLQRDGQWTADYRRLQVIAVKR